MNDNVFDVAIIRQCVSGTLRLNNSVISVSSAKSYRISRKFRRSGITELTLITALQTEMRIVEGARFASINNYTKNRWETPNTCLALIALRYIYITCFVCALVRVAVRNTTGVNRTPSCGSVCRRFVFLFLFSEHLTPSAKIRCWLSNVIIVQRLTQY